MKIILLGPPGSGKGTVAKQLENDFKLKHISTGDILRKEILKGTKLGIKAQEFVSKGRLVPTDIIIKVLLKTIKKQEKFILDGFPRTPRQAKEIKDFKIDCVIYLHVELDLIIERLAGRRICHNGHNYHTKYFPSKVKGVCDIDGSKLKQRDDDHPKIIKQRYKIYEKKTKPLIDYYKKQGILYTVDGTPAPNVVYKKVKQIVKKLK